MFVTNHIKKVLKKVLFIFLYFITVLIVVIVGIFVFLRVPMDDLQLTDRNMNTEYAVAEKNILDAIQKDQNNALINPECYPILKTHGKKTSKAIILLHGFTNCPQQFEPFAELLFESGYNVYIPRMPHHGYKEKVHNAMKELSLNDLKNFSQGVIDIVGIGLGEDTEVLGLSGGAVLASYLGTFAQFHQVYSVAPNLTVIYKPLPKDYYLQTQLINRMPNIYHYWDEEKKENIVGPKYAYPGFWLHSMYPYLAISTYITYYAKHSPVATKGITFIVNTEDEVVDIPSVIRYAQVINEKTYNANIQYVPESFHVPHDLIDIHQTKQNIKEVYPWLLYILQISM